MMQTGTKLYEFEVKKITGSEEKLVKFEGKVLLIVNVASKCGFTKQYDGLQKLYEKYHNAGLEILGFPSNDFLGQEPASDNEIEQFCRLNFGVSFPMFSKISVKGKEIHPLYKFLTDKKTDPKFGGKITWNFNKFLIDRQGNIINRFNSRVTPENNKLIAAIELALDNK